MALQRLIQDDHFWRITSPDKCHPYTLFKNIYFGKEWYLIGTSEMGGDYHLKWGGIPKMGGNLYR